MDNMNNNRTDEVNSVNQPQEEQKSVFPTAVKGIALIIGLFILGNVIGSLTNIQWSDNISAQNQLSDVSTTESTVAESTTVTTTTTLTTEATTKETTTKKETSTKPDKKETTTKKTTTEQATTEDNILDTEEEIVALFNKSANNIKKKAVKITRNYDDKRFDEDMSDYPRVLNLVATPLINSYLVRNEIPVEYTEKDLIKANYPVKGKDWVSKLTADDIANINCVEKIDTYEIELYLQYCRDPEENTKVCAAMEEITLETVQELAPVVKTCSTEYYDCVITCTIEKESGNMTYAKYVQPMVLSITTQAVTERQAIFAMTFESEYIIEY